MVLASCVSVLLYLLVCIYLFSFCFILYVKGDPIAFYYCSLWDNHHFHLSFDFPWSFWFHNSSSFELDHGHFLDLLLLSLSLNLNLCRHLPPFVWFRWSSIFSVCTSSQSIIFTIIFLLKLFNQSVTACMQARTKYDQTFKIAHKLSMLVSVVPFCIFCENISCILYINDL